MCCSFLVFLYSHCFFGFSGFCFDHPHTVENRSLSAIEGRVTSPKTFSPLSPAGRAVLLVLGIFFPPRAQALVLFKRPLLALLFSEFAGSVVSFILGSDLGSLWAGFFFNFVTGPWIMGLCVHLAQCFYDVFLAVGCFRGSPGRFSVVVFTPPGAFLFPRISLCWSLWTGNVLTDPFFSRSGPECFTPICSALSALCCSTRWGIPLFIRTKRDGVVGIFSIFPRPFSPQPHRGFVPP